MTLKINVSAGEFLDKLTILEIKSERIKDEQKLHNIQKELSILQVIWDASPLRRFDISQLMKDLKNVNERLWEIEDLIRQKEAAQTFDDEFVQLARSVYQINDKRAAIKRELNRVLGSDLIEEKSYPDYSPPAS